MFLSDNGWLLGEHRLTSKVLAYADSKRVPLLIAGPGVRPRVESRLALNLDIAPILLDLADADSPAIARRLHGASLLPLVRGESVAWREGFIYECLDGYGGTRPMLGAITPEWALARTRLARAFGGWRLHPLFRGTLRPPIRSGGNTQRCRITRPPRRPFTTNGVAGTFVLDADGYLTPTEGGTGNPEILSVQPVGSTLRLVIGGVAGYEASHRPVGRGSLVFDPRTYVVHGTNSAGEACRRPDDGLEVRPNPVYGIAA